MREIPLQFGDAGRLFGILTLPDEQDGGRMESRVFVFLSAGLLHRIGPHRLYVRLARDLAQSGFNSLRVDLAGIGDSSSRTGLTYQQSVAQDFEEILSVLKSQLGDVSIILAGLCSAADNAIRLAIDNPQVVGMVLLDPVCEKDKGFRIRALGFRVRELVEKSTSLSNYTRWLNRRIRALTNQSSGSDEQVDALSLRVIPPPEQMRAAFESIGRRNGRVLCVFSEYALRYYNQIGQLGRVLELEDYERFCTELFSPHAQHNYPLESHRYQLIEAIKAWVVPGRTRTS